ncbi:hypothetical protein T36_1431 [Helicobacter cinaedi]|uniref:hypothetical protein n=1 Tax=Helicobacter cinaedi TaxID=213 RepID=UPI001F429FF9|nr:hypothetical protein [Helicobacter cinaedi]BDB64969.1 hypothetical protein T36_1431 [Helicobacter cinaedi]
MKNFLKKILAKLRIYFTHRLDSKLDKLTMLHANLLAKQHTKLYREQLMGGGAVDNLNHYENTNAMGVDIRDFEFSAYSQNGEDGILDLLIEILDLDSSYSPYPRAFVEFGVQDYTESNTRYLLKKRNFMGLIMDGNAKHIESIKQDELYWKHDIEAQCAFITRENINALIKQWLDSRKLDNIALLSIDIDGVDYFVWEAIECVKPAIVVVEYNAIFGENLSVSVPYRADFERFLAHHSGLYFGASIKALIALGKKKGYVFIGADSSGTNVFFIHESLESKLAFTTAPLQEYCSTHHARQSRDTLGNLSFLQGNERFEAIKHLPLHTCEY